MSTAKPISTPFSSSFKDETTPEPFQEITKYRQIVGSVQYLYLTRPDLAFAVNRACHFMHSAHAQDWVAIKRILRYLRHTLDYGLQFSKNSSLQIQAFCDADWASSRTDRRSIAGYAVYISHNLIFWGPLKQRTVAQSSTEADTSLF